MECKKSNTVVTLILPKDMTSLQEKYSRALAEVVSEILTTEELNYLITKLEEKQTHENTKSIYMEGKNEPNRD